jgi:predicted amidohydrolase YtcJ
MACHCMTRAVAILLSITVAAASAASESRAAVPAPDLIIYNAHIVTVDEKFSVAQAAAMTSGKFTAVGSTKEVLAAAGANTRKIDLHGRTVLPGFNDTHNHQMLIGKTFYISVDLTHSRSIADIQRAIADKVKRLQPGEWVQGTRGWWEYELSDGRLPTRADLDTVAPRNPVEIPGPHYMIANSLALKLGGITRESLNPQGGEIRKDPRTGEPTGLLFDRAARTIAQLLPKPSPAESAKGVLMTMELNNSNGLTSIGEPSGSMEDLELYRALYDQGRLTTRVDFAFNIDPQEPLEKVQADVARLGPPGHQFGDGMFRADEIGETALDGAELTALLREDFPDRPGYKGMFVVKQQQFNEFAAAVNQAGYRLRPHAVGDGAIDEALTAYEYANAKQSLVGRRWMIDHDFLVMPDHYPRIKALGLILNSQYMHDAQLGKLILKAWHRPLADKMENYKDWLAAGIMFTGGSDGPILYHAEPLYEIYGEVTRQTLWGGVLGADEGITREQAIRSVTSASAYTSFEEKSKGSIEPGKYADFVVLSGDILALPVSEMKNLKVLATVLGGKTVYGDLQ